MHIDLTMGGPTWNHVKKSQHLHLIMGGPACTMLKRIITYVLPWEAQPAPCRKGSTLISDHGRNQSYHHVKRALHLHLTMGGHILPPCQKGSTLTSDHGRNTSCHHVRRSLALITSPWKEPQSEVHTRASFLLSPSYKNSSHINQTK